MFDYLDGLAAVPVGGREGSAAIPALWRNRRWFFGMLIAAHIFDIPETAAKQVDGLREVPPQYWVAAPAFLAIAAVGWATKRRSVHAVLAPAWLAVLVGYEVFSALDQIVAR